MAIDYYACSEAESLRDVVAREKFGATQHSIVGEHWDPHMKVLYVAIADPRGVVTAHLFHDRGPEILGGLPMRGVTEYHESDEPPFAGCPPSFLELLSPPESPVSAGWRRMFISNSKWLSVFVQATNGSQTGDQFIMTPPRGSSDVGFCVRVTADRRFESVGNSRWPGLARAVDLLARGCQLVVLKNRGAK